MPASPSIKAVIHLKNYFKRIHFGFAAARLALNQELFQECAECQNFSALEISVEQLRTISAQEKEKLRKQFSQIHCGSLLEPSLTQLILYAGVKIQSEFIRTCASLFDLLQKEKISAGRLDFDLNSILYSEEDMKLLKKMLRNLSPALQRSGCTLLLPIRLPAAEQPDLPVRAASFLREMMIPNIKLCISIYPHEMKPDFAPNQLAETLFFETGAIHFCCNADCGNKFMRVHLIPWLKYYALTSFPGPWFFCPFSHENRMAAAVCKECSDLAGEILRSAE